VPNATYRTVGDWRGRLDLYVRQDPAEPMPTVMFVHGGGWTRGSKEQATLAVFSYLDIGLNVVNVEYRLAQAPAAVEDCTCALRWMAQHAVEYGIDVHRLVVAGDSAGAQLAMTIAMSPASERFDAGCADAEAPAVAAIVNWYGPSDMTDLVDGPHRLPDAVDWVGPGPERAAMARRLSPIAFVRPGVPALLTIHGDRDELVPYAQSVALHAALTAAGVPNQLLTIAGGAHGPLCCDTATRSRAYDTIRSFLLQQRVLDRTSASP
jgi:acetyl esterase/lipase